MRLSTALFMFLLLLWPVGAEDIVVGPVEAVVLRVIDGDSVQVRAHVWPKHYVEENVRIAGVDAPELRGHCDAERSQARAAKAFVETLLASKRVRLLNLRRGKFRYLADMQTAAGQDVATALLQRGLARVYSGGDRPGWCG